MDFGKLADISKVDFSLPPVSSHTAKILTEYQKKTEPKKIEIFAGCPIWANPHWIGSTYPIGTRERDYLKFYATQFNTIELNVTHYQIPPPSTVTRWKKNVTQGFKFAPKFPQEISHQLLLEGTAKAKTILFCDTIRGLEEHLGTCFLQLPPNFRPQMSEKLVQFLDEMPLDIDLAIEFRHPDWFRENTFEQIAKTLEQRKIGTVITDVAGRRDVIHLRLTTPTLMLRFVGNDLHPTDYSRVDEWVKILEIWLRQGLKTVYFFAHEPDNNSSPDLVKYFLQQLNLIGNFNTALPKSYQQPTQGSLF